MKVYYNKTWAFLFLGLGTLLLLLTLLLYFLSGEIRLRTIFPGVFTLAFGILYYRSVYFIVHEKEIVLYGLLGNVARRYSFENYSDLIPDGNRLYLNKNGKLKRIWISRSMVHPAHWNQFLELIKSDDLSKEIHEM